ncbi:MAG: hypothetical protein IT181_04480 [Acidobacteria bacterium]|nr:hypothetical protein [Acidobacteriota bacterium]
MATDLLRRRGVTRTHAALFAAACAAYAVGAWWGLPEGLPGRDRPWGTDELGPLGAVNEIYGVFAARQPAFNPQYPLFHYLVQLIFVAPVYVALWATGHVSTPAPMFPYGLDHPPAELALLTLASRLPSLLMAAGVVVMAYETGTVLRDRRAGLWAALFTGLLYPVVYYARTGNVDMGALFWTAAGLLVFARCLMDQVTRGRLLSLAVYAALAAGSKDANYAAFVPAGALAAWWHARARRAGGASWLQAAAAPAQALLLALAAYAVASGVVFRPSRYVEHLRYVTAGSTTSAFYFRNPPTLEGYLAFAGELGQQFVDAFGWPLLLCTAAGVAVWAFRDRRRLLWILPALSICVLVIVPVRFALLRFVLPVVYVLIFAAADLVSTWRPRGRVGVVARGVLVAVVVGFTAARAVDLTRQMVHDSRDAATAWLARAGQPGDAVGYFELDHQRVRHQFPRLPPDIDTVLVTPGTLAAGTARPAFVMSIPLDDFEIDHEDALPAETFAQLMDGTLGYRPVAVVQAPAWFTRRPATFVNPPIRFYARDDVVAARPALRLVARD